MLFQSSLVFFVDSLVDIGKLGIAIVFLQQAVLLSCNFTNRSMISSSSLLS